MCRRPRDGVRPGHKWAESLSKPEVWGGTGGCAWLSQEEEEEGEATALQRSRALARGGLRCPWSLDGDSPCF